MSDSATPWTAAHQASLSFTVSWSLLKFIFIQLAVPSNHLIPCCPLLLSIFPASGSFPVSQPFTSGGQNVIFSFSINLSNEHPGLISFRIDWLDLLCSPRDPQESSPTPQFFSAHPLYGPTLTSVHDCWKNRSFGDMDLCQQGEVSAF